MKGFEAFKATGALGEVEKTISGNWLIVSLRRDSPRRKGCPSKGTSKFRKKNKGLLRLC